VEFISEVVTYRSRSFMKRFSCLLMPELTAGSLCFRFEDRTYFMLRL